MGSFSRFTAHGRHLQKGPEHFRAIPRMARFRGSLKGTNCGRKQTTDEPFLRFKTSRLLYWKTQTARMNTKYRRHAVPRPRLTGARLSGEEFGELDKLYGNALRRTIRDSICRLFFVVKKHELVHNILTMQVHRISPARQKQSTKEILSPALDPRSHFHCCCPYWKSL